MGILHSVIVCVCMWGGVIFFWELHVSAVWILHSLAEEINRLFLFFFS